MAVSHKAVKGSRQGKDILLQKYSEAVYSTNVTGSYNIDLANGNVQILTLTGNATLGFLNERGVGYKDPLTIIIKQDATGGWTVTWTGSVSWISNSPDIGTAANNVEVFTLFTPDGGIVWYGVQESLEFAASGAIAAGDITSGTFADARIAASNVTQHVAAIDHDALLNFSAAEHLDWSADQGATDLHVNNISAAGVTQHQAALSITESQVSDLQAYLLDTTDTFTGTMTVTGDLQVDNININGNNITTTTGNITIDPAGAGTVTITGDLTVDGTTTTTNSNEVNIGDAILTLNYNEAGTPSQNAGIEIERGTSANVQFLWNETTDAWEIDSNRLLTVADEGTGNGLDADTVDGVHASALLRSDIADTAAGEITFTSGISVTGDFSGDPSTVPSEIYLSSISPQITFRDTDHVDATGEFFWHHFNAGSFYFLMNRGTSNTWVNPHPLRVNTTAEQFIIWDTVFNADSDGTVTVNGNRVLTIADEGTGNGLDADTVDGLEGASFLRSDQADTATGLITFDNGANSNEAARVQATGAFTSPFISLYNTTRQGLIQALTGTQLIIKSEMHGALIRLQGEDAGGTAQNMLDADPDTSVDLYYAGDKKFETTNTGATVTGDLTVTGGDITLSGTGRIQGIDTVSAATDAANKQYVDDQAGAGIEGAQAWVNFNGTGTVAIRSSHNMSSVTDNGVGRYTINYSTALPNANYAIVATGANDGYTQAVIVKVDATTTQTTTGCLLEASNNNTANAEADIEGVYAVVFHT
jgi:hypothetical protein